MSNGLAKDRSPPAVVDRRAEPRVAITVPLTLQLDDGRSIPGGSLDLGRGGVCAGTARGFPCESIAQVRIGLRGSTISAPARGAWQRSTPSEALVTTGIQFVELTKHDEARLGDALDDRVRTLTRFLIGSQALAPLDPPDARALTLRSRCRHFPADVRLYERNATGGETSIFIVATGEVALELPGPRGATRRAAMLGSGDVFGGVSLLTELSHAESAGTATACELIEVDASALELLRYESPRMARALERGVVRRLAAALDLALEREPYGPTRR